jgi:hypothetical protein
VAANGAASPRINLWGAGGPPTVDVDSPLRRVHGPPTRILLGVSLVAVAGMMLAVAGEVGAAASETWAAIIVAALLVAFSVPIAAGAARRDADPKLTWILIGSVAAKLLGAFFRYSLAYTIHYSDGRTDANRYFSIGIALADQGFEFGDRVGVGVGDAAHQGIVGTHFIDLLTGAMYVVLPPSRLAGFFVFAFLSWIGLFFFTRAFRIAFPDGAHRRYDLLVLFLPSMLFWPSSIGKEAWMTMTIGLAAYGAARLLARRRGGYLVLGLGLWGTAMVRPHVTLILALAAVVAYPIRRSTKRSTAAPITKTVGFAVLVVAALVVASQAQAFFDVDSLEPESVTEVLNSAEERSATGGSEFSAEPVQSIRDLPEAFIAVPFRPFPWEATDWLQMLAAVEGLVLLGLFIRNAPRLLRIPRDMLRRPYITFAVVYSLGFVVAFSTIGNFGILVRQRVQLFPFLLVLVVPIGELVKRRWPEPEITPLPPARQSPSAIPARTVR